LRTEADVLPPPEILIAWNVALGPAVSWMSTNCTKGPNQWGPSDSARSCRSSRLRQVQKLAGLPGCPPPQVSRAASWR